MKNALIIKHVDFEGPGLFLKILKESGFNIIYCNAGKDEFPALKSFELMLIMGGPMSVNDEEAYPWLIEEKQYIRNAILKQKKMIGICLGSQLIASALGEDVFLGEEEEVGWFPVLIENKLVNVFHWHAETFDLPTGAEHLASSAAFENQIFKYKEHVLALQCHLEMDEPALKSMLYHCGNQLRQGRFVMSAEQIMDGLTICQDESYRLLKILIGPFLDNQTLPRKNTSDIRHLAE